MLIPLSPERHGARRWRRSASYAFAAERSVAPLAAAEMPRAAVAMPLGFLDNKGTFLPVAILGFAGGRNLYVAPDGRWLGLYVPAALRGHPFALVPNSSGQLVLCVDEDSGLLGDAEGEPFFGDDGQASEPVSEVLRFLTRAAAAQRATRPVCAALQEHGLIVPWPIKVQGKAGEIEVRGMFRIDESALNALSAGSFEEVRRAGALAVAYCQLLSMQHLPRLAELARLHARQTPAGPSTAGGDLDLSFLGDSGTISFGNG